MSQCPSLTNGLLFNKIMYLLRQSAENSHIRGAVRTVETQRLRTLDPPSTVLGYPSVTSE